MRRNRSCSWSLPIPPTPTHHPGSHYTGPPIHRDHKRRRRKRRERSAKRKNCKVMEGRMERKEGKRRRERKEEEGVVAPDR